MTVDEDWDATRSRASAGEPFRLDRAVASLYADLRLTPMLHTLLAHTRELVDGVAGSISVVDPEAGTYRKVAERGVSCQLGRTFSLMDGATGQAVARGAPVVIDDYSAIAARHLRPDHPANRGSVAAVPIWWRGQLIGVNVAFAGRRRRFTTREIDRLELLTQTAAGAIVTAGAGEPSLTRLVAVLVERVPGRGTTVRVDLPCAPLDPPLDGQLDPPPDLALDDRAGAGGTTAAGGRTVAGRVAGAVPAVRTPPPPSPLTPRETEVLAMVATGLSDREIARRLVLSPKTVEKHVGSAIRKTGSASRTGAAVHGREQGWI